MYTLRTKSRTTRNVTYKISCSDCDHADKTYIAETMETGRTLVCRMSEHTNQREPTTAVGEHISIKRQNITEEAVKVPARE